MLAVLAQALLAALRERLPGYHAATPDTLRRRFLEPRARSSTQATPSPSALSDAPTPPCCAKPTCPPRPPSPGGATAPCATSSPEPCPEPVAWKSALATEEFFDVRRAFDCRSELPERAVGALRIFQAPWRPHDDATEGTGQLIEPEPFDDRRVTKQLGIVFLQPGEQQRAAPQEFDEGSQLEVARTPPHPFEVQQGDEASVVPQHVREAGVAVDHHQVVRYEGVHRAQLVKDGSHGVDDVRINEGKAPGCLHQPRGSGEGERVDVCPDDGGRPAGVDGWSTPQRCRHAGRRLPAVQGLEDLGVLPDGCSSLVDREAVPPVAQRRARKLAGDGPAQHLVPPAREDRWIGDAFRKVGGDQPLALEAGAIPPPADPDEQVADLPDVVGLAFHQQRIAGPVELGELVVGAGEADLQSLDLAEPAFAFGLGDAGDEVVADLHQPVALGRVGPQQRASDASVLVDAGRAECPAAGPDRDLPAFEVAEELGPFLLGRRAVFLAGSQRPPAG